LDQQGGQTLEHLFALQQQNLQAVAVADLDIEIT
jgi:hypothetical protein